MVAMFFKMCESTGLNPLNRHAYIIPRRDTKANTTKYSMQVSIDGFRSIAEKTGQYIGSSEPLFDKGLTEYECRASNKANPITATVTVSKNIDGVVGHFTAVASWDSYAVTYNGKASGLWLKFPYLMLAKCAEALALRKAFPSVLGGLYTPDEMQQAGGIDLTPKKPSVILMNWALQNGLTKEQVIEAKNVFFPNDKDLNETQGQELKEKLELMINELKAVKETKELFATKDVEGVYGKD
jgi:phage recombination protein Bet